MNSKSIRKRKISSQTLLEAYDQDLDRFKHRVGKDRSERSLRAMQQGRQYVAAFLADWMHIDDIPLTKLMPQFIHDFSIYLSTDRGLRGGTIWLACQLLKGVVTRAHARGLLEWNPFGQEACTLLRARHLYICSLHRFGFYRHQGTQAFRYGHHQWWHMDCLKAT